jgi:uncharacterized protein YebE (UPF0316 family)
MLEPSFFDSNLFNWLVLPAVIFLARVSDVSIGTVRIIMIGQGRRLLASLCGFAEVSIWLLVARHVILHMPNPVCFIAYAAGFASGNYAGMWIEELMAVGTRMLRVVIDEGGEELVAALNSRGYGVTIFPARGARGAVDVLYVIFRRNDMPELLEIIRGLSPKAFYTIEDVKFASEGIFPHRSRAHAAFWRKRQEHQ